MWPDTVDFRSASSEISWRKKKKKQKCLVKYKSANNYVGRPNKFSTAVRIVEEKTIL